MAIKEKFKKVLPLTNSKFANRFFFNVKADTFMTTTKKQTDVIASKNGFRFAL